MNAIQTTTDRAMVPIENGRLVPSDLDGMWRVATALAKSGLLPSGLRQPEQAFVLVNTACELGIGFTDAISGIAVVNGRPILHSRLPAMLMQRHRQYAGMTTEWAGLAPDGGITDKAVCTVTVYRMHQLADGKFEKMPYSASFGVADAKQAGLWGRDTYKSYPKDMLMSKARKRAIDAGFADAMGGMPSMAPEDESEYNAAPRRVVNEVASLPPSKATAALDALPEGEGGAAPASEAPGVAAPPEPVLDVVEIAAAVEAEVAKPKRKKPAFDADGNPVD